MYFSHSDYLRSVNERGNCHRRMAKSPPRLHLIFLLIEMHGPWKKIWTVWCCFSCPLRMQYLYICLCIKTPYTVIVLVFLELFAKIRPSLIKIEIVLTNKVLSKPFVHSGRFFLVTIFARHTNNSKPRSLKQHFELPWE